MEGVKVGKIVAWVVMCGWEGERTKGGHKLREKELEEGCEETREGGAATEMWMENSAVFLCGRPAPEQRSERIKQRQTMTGTRGWGRGNERHKREQRRKQAC